MHQRSTATPEPNCTDCGSRSDSVFSAQSPSELTVLSTSKSCRSYPRGAVIYYNGDRPAGLHCINQGKIKICKNGHDAREQIIRLVGPGNIMGYRSLLGSTTYSTFAVAIEDSRVCFIPRSEFTSMIAVQPDLALRLMALLSNELRMAENRMVELAQKSSRERLAETLLLLETKYGHAADGKTVAVKLTRSELAGLVGTVTESVIRLLSELSKEGIVDLDRSSIIILDRERLLEIANVGD